MSANMSILALLMTSIHGAGGRLIVFVTKVTMASILSLTYFGEATFRLYTLYQVFLHYELFCNIKMSKERQRI